MKSKPAKSSRGGSRPGAGRKPKDYKTIVITFRVREEWAQPIKDMVALKIISLSKKSKLTADS